MNIALVDDQLILVESLKSMLMGALPDVDLIKIHTSNQAFLTEQKAEIPDVLITESSFSGINTSELMSSFRQLGGNQMKIIVLSSIMDAEKIIRTMKSGADAYLSKHCSKSELLQAIQDVRKGKKFFSKSVKEVLIDRVFQKKTEKFHLSTRQTQLLTRICEGYTIKETAEQMNISLRTARYHQRVIMDKFGVNRTINLVMVAVQQGFFKTNSELA